MFGIRIATYHRRNGTYHLLRRCLKSILAQTYPHWKIFIVGDHYEPEEEFWQAIHDVPNNKIWATNLDRSVEREKYSGYDLWRVAGCTASRTGLAKVTEEGLIHAPLDDDDYWLPCHLETLAQAYKDFPEAAFIYTQSTYNGGILPKDRVEVGYNNLPPQAYRLIHSAASWDTCKIKLGYPNVIEERSAYVAGDAEMWERIRMTGCKSVYISKLTVHHDYEQGGHMVEPLLI